MKTKLFFFIIFSIFLLYGCNRDKVFVEITSPKDGDVFSINDIIIVKVEASTEKGFISLVELDVETLESHKMVMKPYVFEIPARAFEDPNTGGFVGPIFRYISVTAHNSKGDFAGDVIDIIIK
ncbi:MAG: hypothetical protein LBI45_08180 [Bacteroidales bacterium]|jgi:hypothetical protein|nr:hypothetical protein [Bacteroidales bacterium]